METLSFAFGMLAMFAVILVIAVVVGIVKVHKQEKQIINLERILSDFDRNLSEQIRDVYNEIHNKSDVINDQHNEVYRYIDSRLDKLESKLISKTEKQLLKN